jgi:hypothetical protein
MGKKSSTVNSKVKKKENTGNNIEDVKKMIMLKMKTA